jgi:hypothetical protein
MRYLFLVVVLTVFSSVAFSQEVKSIENEMEQSGCKKHPDEKQVGIV